MDADYWIGELGRLYERSSEAIDEEYSNAVEPLAGEFNEALEQLQNEFGDNQIVSNTAPVEPFTEGSYRDGVISTSRRRDEALHEIRSRCEKMANAIGYELPEAESGAQRAGQMMMVSVNQEATQDVNQEVSVESIMQLIDVDPMVQGSREELKELVDGFERELEKEDADPGRLRQFIEEAKSYSTSVAARMAIHALHAGAIGILAL